MKAEKTIIILFFTLLPFLSFSQSAGSFGDPVVNIDFGSGSGPYFPATTAYRRIYNDCPNDGSYTIASQTHNCFNAVWYTLTEDHTPGDQNGYMMIVNSDPVPGKDFYRQNVTGLCPNTTYEFAAWILNVNIKDDLYPNVTFIIETPGGTALDSVNTGDIGRTAIPEWKKYSLIFTTGSGQPDIVLAIKNNAPGGAIPGNDLALDDITFRPYGPHIAPAASANNTNNTLCEGEAGNIQLNADIIPYNNQDFLWQMNNNDGSGWTDHPEINSLNAVFPVQSAQKNGYKFRLLVAEAGNILSPKCRTISDSILVSVIPKPVADAGPDKITQERRPVQLGGSVAGTNITYFWTPADYLDDPNSLTPVASPAEDITYTLHVTSNNGCNAEASDQVFVKVFKELKIPNTFSPNDDGINDTWNIIALNSYPKSVLTVYNRYGSVVFRSAGYPAAWNGKSDGKDLPAGTYYYTLDLKEEGKEILKGWVMIIR